jgi:hypothetical protein
VPFGFVIFYGTTDRGLKLWACCVAAMWLALTHRSLRLGITVGIDQLK